MSIPRLCVVGSINLDMNAYTPRFPKPGETLHGHRFTTGYGGKGANQAVAAGRVGGAVSMVGRVGDDLFGRDMLQNLAAEGIDATHVSTSAGISSGVAVITIDDHAENNIIVIAGANAQVSPADIEAARAVIANAQVVVCQLEIPLAANIAAMRVARAAGVMTILNSAPVGGPLPDELYQLSDIFCPNENEAELLTGIAVRTEEEAVAAARVILGRGAASVILTLGARGSLLVSADAVRHAPAPRVTAVDTTGAGDAFVGSLAVFLAGGLPLFGAMQRANQIAALSVQKPGTQSSYPRRADLPDGIWAT